MKDATLLDHVLSTSFIVPDWEGSQIEAAYTWCKSTFGEERAGDIVHEAQGGWLDYSDGDWCMSWYATKATWVFWFSSRSRLAQFTLTWS